MKILLFNQDWFLDELREWGHEVRTCGMAKHLEAVLPTPYLPLDRIFSDHLGGFEPDVIIWFDNSSPVLVQGLADTRIPAILYSIDTHHHFAVHRYLAHVFDLTMIAQKDYLPEFHAVGSDAAWLPLWASRFQEASDDKKYGAVFVGNLNANLNPKRVQFFEALCKEVPLMTMTGEFWKIFPYSEIVVNQTVKGDLNFRVFEAMMSGALLLTERSQNGLFDLFTDGEHLVCYEKDNVKDAAEKIRMYLADIPAARRIGEAGRAEILAKHLPVHRAEVLLNAVKQVKKTNSGKKHFAQAYSASVASRSLETMDTQAFGILLIRSLRSFEQGLERGEIMDDFLCLEAIYSCFRYDQVYSSAAGTNLLARLHEAYPLNNPLLLARMRDLLNKGKLDEASDLSKNAFGEAPKIVFQQAEKLVAAILASAETLKNV